MAEGIKAVLGFLGDSVVKNPPANAEDAGGSGLIPESGRSARGGNSNPLQYCLENSMDRGAWRATVHGVAKNRTRLSINACEVHERHQYLGRGYFL